MIPVSLQNLTGRSLAVANVRCCSSGIADQQLPGELRAQVLTFSHIA